MRVMKIICRSLLDNAVTLSQKNTLIFYLHELNAEYGRKRGKVPRNAQFEILTCLVDLCKILRTQLASTLALIKLQETEQEQTEGDKPEFEIGEKGLLQAAKPYKQQKNIKNGDISEPHREVFGKVMWNLVASAELVFGIAREQRQ